MAKRGTYNRYSTGYKMLYQYGLLSKSATRKIKPSTKQYWDKQDFTNLIGLNLAHVANEQMAVLEAKILQLEKKVKALRLLVGLMKAVILSNQKVFKKALVKNGTKVLSVIERVQKLDFTLSKACFFIGITPKRFHYIKNIVNRKCGLSIKELCYKRYPNQLTREEVQAIIDYTNKYYPKWPLSSIRRQMKRDKVAHISKSTFYHYCRLLHITKKAPKWKRRNSKTTAKAPFEILHMDVTILPLEDGTKAYIYILMDNYSRFIFSATASLTLSSEENKQNIIKALKQYRDLFAKQKSIRLICDGGGENKGEVDILLEDLENKPYKILKEIANNVTIFNTLVEASHYNLKRYHFLKKGYANIKALQAHLQQCIYDNNFVIPKERLEGLLPSEVLIENIRPDKHQYQKEEEEARRKRIETNQKFNCELLCLKDFN